MLGFHLVSLKAYWLLIYFFLYSCRAVLLLRVE